MKQARKVIITCAVTGSIHTPSMSPHLPVTPQEIADAALGAAEAGAAIVHLHARNPQDGRPEQTSEAFLRFLPQIKRASDVVINLTTGGAPTMSVEERMKPAVELKPEVASLNLGSMNFGLYEMLERYKEFRHDWERPYLEGSEDRVFRNTFRDIAGVLQACSANRTRFDSVLGTGRPEEVVAALGDAVGASLELTSIVRERLILAEEQDPSTV